MTVVPLPDIPCVRVRVIWNEGAVGEGGVRFYLSYSGSAPTGANCTTLAGDIAAQVETNLCPQFTGNYTVNEVDVLDIGTDSGLSGQWTGSHPGTFTSASGQNMPDSVAMNVEFGIGRRYRGGKPRMFLPPADTSALSDASTWAGSHVSGVSSAVAAFFAALEALSIGAMGTLQHVNLSYYKGFTNITNSSGRERAVPTYRATALHDNVTGYFAKATVGSQRRRRTSTTP